MKKIIIFMLFVLLLGCSSRPTEKYTCPQIIIPRATTRTYQNDITDKFQINMVGHESYCYQEDADKRYYAVITPIFKVRRLEPSDTTNVDADFYVKTSVNDKDYIGIRTFSQTLNIPKDTKEIRLKGRPTINRISTPPYREFKIYLGMDLDGSRKTKAKKMFDIDYMYLSEEEINAQNEKALENVTLEVLPDEEIIYSEELQKPIVVKKNRLKNECQN
jgi:hypothetical protein